MNEESDNAWFEIFGPKLETNYAEEITDDEFTLEEMLDKLKKEKSTPLREE